MKIDPTGAKSRPVSGTSKAVSAYSATEAAAPVRTPTDTTSILGIPETELTPKVLAAIMTLMEEVSRLRQELQQTQARLQHLETVADQDTLIPAFNRRAFVRELSRFMSFAERYGTPSSLLYFDLNTMKRINDSYGHAAGDAALVQVAKVLMDNVRQSDVVGRLGGDELGVILVNCDQKLALDKGASLSAAIAARPLNWEGQSVPLSVAYGAYSFRSGDDVNGALANADQAMYAQKQAMKAGR